jgi:methyl-accepting chemotaxis protein
MDSFQEENWVFRRSKWLRPVPFTTRSRDGECSARQASARSWLSMRARKRVEKVNQRVQRSIAGDLRERLPHRNVDEPLSRLAVIVNGMLDEMETMIHALAGETCRI